MVCKVLNDLKETVPFSLVTVNGGKAYNAIADSAEAVITAAASDEAAIQELVKSAEQTLIETYAGIESSISLTVAAGNCWSHCNKHSLIRKQTGICAGSTDTYAFF